MLTRDDVDELVRALHAKRITANEYLKRTQSYWNRIAGGIWRRWRKKLGASAEREDVEQLFLIQVIKHSLMWRPERGVPPTRYLLTPSKRRTLREIHVLRGAKIHGNEGKNPSRPETPFARFARPAGEEGAEVDPCDFRPTPATQERDVALARALPEGKTRKQQIFFAAIRESRGDLDDAASFLYGSQTLRLACELKSPKQARRALAVVARARLGNELVSAA